MVKIKQSIVYCQEIKKNILKDFDKLLSNINFCGYIKKNDVILIKPNICTTSVPSSGAITKPLLLVHLAKRIRELGGRPIIAESSIGIGITGKAFEVSGLNTLCLKNKINLLNLDYDKPFKKGKFIYCSIINKVDKIINFPVIKTHHQQDLKVSLSLKNLMGLVWKNQKSIMHVRGIEGSLIEINKTIKPVLNILDATIGMEGNGPVAGLPVKVGLLLASEDRVALDSVGCYLMGQNIPSYIKKASLSGLGTIKPKIVGANASKFMKKFKKAPSRKGIIPSFKDFLLSISFLHKFLFRNFAKVHKSPKLNIPYVVKDSCISCGNCKRICPFKAIKFEDNYPVFDNKKCVKCYACVEICPKAALKN